MEQSANEMKEIISGWMDDKIDNVHTSLPGKIISFDPGTNRAQVQPVGKYKLDDGRELNYPIIHQVPIVFPMGCGGNSGITFPVRPGDGCMIAFAESQLDDFISGGDSDDARRHDLNDAICIPGLYSQSAPTVAGSADSVCLINNGSKVELKPSSCEITLADGTICKIGGGDLVVNGISLVKHVHGGVESGGSKTGKPE